MTSPYRFDPRRNSAVTLRFVEKVPTNSTLYRSQEVPVKSFVVGPHVRGRPQSLTIPDTSMTDDPSPPFLEKDGTWSPNGPQFQFSNTVTLSPRATLTNSNEVQPVAAVHSYYDASPVAVHEVVREGTLSRPMSAGSGLQRSGIQTTQTFGIQSGDDATLAKSSEKAVQTLRPTNGRPISANRRPASAPRMSSRPATPRYDQTKTMNGKANGTINAWQPSPSPKAELSPTHHLWHTSSPSTKQPDIWSPYGAPLRINDLEREKDLAQPVVPGSANCKLVGGRWRYIPANSPGDPVYTDYYGRFAGEANNYYGRSYHTTTYQFAKNKLVNDEAYMRVQASMPGITDLRYRPGMVLRTTLQNGPTEMLGAPNIHQISDFYRMRPTIKA